MSDRKVARKSVARKTRRNVKVSLPTSLPLNTMLYEFTYQYGQIAANTSGVLSAADISPTIQNSTEYSLLNQIFAESKCISCTVHIGTLANSSTTTITAIVGTKMGVNATTHDSTPLSSSQVENLENKVVIPAGPQNNRVFHYRMKMPKDLDFSLITADAPATQTPWAGAPGCTYIYANGATASTTYMYVYVKARHLLRGRV